MQNSTRASRALAHTGSPSGARRAVKTSSAAFVSLLFCRFSAWASRFITFKVNFSILSPHLSRRLMRNQPRAGASVRAGSVPLCNLNSIQHSPLFPPLPTRFLATNVEKGDLNFRQKHLPEKQNKIKNRSRSPIIYLLLYYPRVLLFSPCARHSHVKPARFYFKILGRGGENSKRLRSYLLPSRIQDHRS